jgi:hypothetical protein
MCWVGVGEGDGRFASEAFVAGAGDDDYGRGILSVWTKDNRRKREYGLLTRLAIDVVG